MRRIPTGICFGLHLNSGQNSEISGSYTTSLQQKIFFLFVLALHLNLGAKFRTEIELFSVTKLRQNDSPYQTLLNQ